MTKLKYNPIYAPDPVTQTPFKDVTGHLPLGFVSMHELRHVYNDVNCPYIVFYDASTYTLISSDSGIYWNRYEGLGIYPDTYPYYFNDRIYFLDSSCNLCSIDLGLSIVVTHNVRASRLFILDGQLYYTNIEDSKTIYKLNSNNTGSFVAYLGAWDDITVFDNIAVFIQDYNTSIGVFNGVTVQHIPLYGYLGNITWHTLNGQPVISFIIHDSEDVDKRYYINLITFESITDTSNLVTGSLVTSTTLDDGTIIQYDAGYHRVSITRNGTTTNYSFAGAPSPDMAYAEVFHTTLGLAYIKAPTKLYVQAGGCVDEKISTVNNKQLQAFITQCKAYVQSLKNNS